MRQMEKPGSEVMLWSRRRVYQCRLRLDKTFSETLLVGQRVVARRNELGLSQEAAAEPIGLNWTYFGQVERGRRNLTLHNILKIAHGVDIDAGTLISGLAVPVEG